MAVLAEDRQIDVGCILRKLRWAMHSWIKRAAALHAFKSLYTSCLALQKHKVAFYQNLGRPPKLSTTPDAEPIDEN